MFCFTPHILYDRFLERTECALVKEWSHSVQTFIFVNLMKMFLYDSAFILWRGNVNNGNGMWIITICCCIQWYGKWSPILFYILYVVTHSHTNKNSPHYHFLNGLIIPYIFKNFLRLVCILPTLQIAMEIIPSGGFPLCKSGRGKPERERRKGESLKNMKRIMGEGGEASEKERERKKYSFSHQLSLQNNMKILLVLAQSRPCKTNGWAGRLLLVHVNKRLLCLWFSVAARKGRAFLQT